VSNALSRLRLIVGDDLFVRTPQGMRPTPRALELAGPVGNALEQIRVALSASEKFDPSNTQRQFSIGVSDNVDFALSTGFPKIVRTAPCARFDIIDATGVELAISMLDSGSIEIAVGLFHSLPKRIDSVWLYSERYICVARRGHPDLVGGLTLEKLAALPHLSIKRDTAGIVDAALAEKGLARRIAVQVPTFALVPHMLEGSDLLTVVGERIGRGFSRSANLECHTLPLALQAWEISAAWRRQTNPDEGVLWLVSMLRQAADVL
jgi:DNA-binding transcriptional LysR family regulator